jgi:pimeloyl-ACP methyl ester carboxylesterase
MVGSKPEHRLSQFERLTLTGGRELDRALLHVGRQMTLFSAESGLTPFSANSFQEAVRFYGESAPDLREQLRSGGARARYELYPVHGLYDGVVTDVRFESAFQTSHPLARELYDRHPENATVNARWWRHREPPTATVVAVHGWTMGDQRLNSLAFLPGVLYRLGLDVVLFELPFHGRRRRGEEPVVFPSTDIVATNEAMVQSMFDLRSLHSILEAEGAREVGAIGMSLGAYVAAVWASVERLAFCVPVVPLVSMSDLAWRVVEANPRLNANGAGVTRDVLEDLFRHHAPLALHPETPGDRALIVASRNDAVVPVDQPERLHAHWNGARLVWVEGGHEALFQRSSAFREVVGFLTGRGFIKPPNSADLHPTS